MQVLARIMRFLFGFRNHRLELELHKTRASTRFRLMFRSTVDQKCIGRDEE